jgi:hypothetical protein
MTKTKKPSVRELPLVKRCIATLLEKTKATGCPSDQATAAVQKTREPRVLDEAEPLIAI